MRESESEKERENEHGMQASEQGREGERNIRITLHFLMNTYQSRLSDKDKQVFCLIMIIH